MQMKPERAARDALIALALPPEKRGHRYCVTVLKNFVSTALEGRNRLYAKAAENGGTHSGAGHFAESVERDDRTRSRNPEQATGEIRNRLRHGFG